MREGSGENYIGRRVLRREDDRLLRGLGHFLDDVAEPPGTCHLAFVRSPHAHARIQGIDAAAALDLPGVVAVLVGAEVNDLAKPMCPDYDQPGYKVTERTVMAVERARFVGDAVAVVVAESAYIAEDAVELVELDCEPLPAVVDLDAALAPGAPPVHEHAGDNVLYNASFATEGFEEAFAAADHVFGDDFVSSRIAAVSIEPRGCLAEYDPGDDTLVFRSSTQIPHVLRTCLSDLLAWPETRIRVVTPDVGGGFGMKAHIYPEEIVAAALARKFRCAIKWVQDRREDLLTSTHARDYRYRVDIAVDNEGILKAIRARVHVNIGAYPSFPFGCSVEAGGAAIYLPGPYRLEHYAYETSAVTTHVCPSGVYRGVAQPVAFFATEGLMDRIARALGIDPAELRLRNLIAAPEFPYVNVVGIRYDAGSYVESLRRALDLIDYDGWRQTRRAPPGAHGKYRGIGIACITEHTGQGASRYRARGLLRVPGFDSAMIKVEPTGQVIAYISHATQGQGHLTSFAQVVAQHLGVKIENVMIAEGDTALAPYGSGTFASRAAVTGGGAALIAAGRLREKIARIGGHMLEVSPEDVDVDEGYVQVRGVPDLRVSVEDVAAVAYSLDSRTLPDGESYGLEAIDYYDPPSVSVTNACHIACVAVDAATGLVEVERYVVVHDCGRLINPTIVDGQIQGAVAQGLGQVLMEAIRYDDQGQLLTGHLMDYVVPTARDVPDMVIEYIETPSTETAGGFKGAGEGGVIGSVPAIANAVGDALAPLGVTITRMPLTAGYVLSLIEAAQGQ